MTAYDVNYDYSWIQASSRANKADISRGCGVHRTFLRAKYRIKHFFIIWYLLLRSTQRVRARTVRYTYLGLVKLSEMFVLLRSIDRSERKHWNEAGIAPKTSSCSRAAPGRKILLGNSTDAGEIRSLYHKTRTLSTRRRSGEWCSRLLWTLRRPPFKAWQPWYL